MRGDTSVLIRNHHLLERVSYTNFSSGVYLVSVANILSFFLTDLAC